MSIKIENIKGPSAEQWDSVIMAMRNPLNSWEKSDSGLCECGGRVDFTIGKNDMDLMKRLAKAGSDHRKFVRMLPVWMDITAPIFWIAEHDTYKVATVRNSCSFMHKGCARPFTIEDFSVYGEKNRRAVEAAIIKLNELRDEYLKTKDETVFQQIRSILPSGYNQRYTWTANYEVLYNIYQSRRNHRLPEWREFCRIIVCEVPYFAEIYGIESDERGS